MVQARVSTFGKRGAPVRPAAVAAVKAGAAVAGALTSTESGLPLDEIARRLMSGESSDRSPESAPAGAASAGAVPWSARAATLAGLSAACLQAGRVVLSPQSAVPDLSSFGVHIDASSGVAYPALIAFGLWSGGTSAAQTMLLTHFGLRAAGQTSPVAYAIAGAAMGAGLSWATVLLMGGEPAMVADATLGIVSGFLYRVFAGVKSKT